ncbi:MAG: ATP-binding cassette domain-containing protein [Candidatus Moduliflexus flocculans]|nr:ATP-binding cassette domain-containing protein [Candidatus Moduliflexus flocculans]
MIWRSSRGWTSSFAGGNPRARGVSPSRKRRPVVKLLCGLARPNRGTIEIDGREVQNLTPKTSLQHKIGVIHQDATLIGSLNAVENVCAGLIRTPWYGRMRTMQMVQHTREILDELGVSLDLKVPVRRLAKADQHMVELARLVMIDPDILVFDEISGKLTPDEMELVYKLLFKYRNLGRESSIFPTTWTRSSSSPTGSRCFDDGALRGTEEIGNIDKAKLINLTYSFVLSREELSRRISSCTISKNTTRISSATSRSG